jgi:beta-N-acetylhexosaminidase
VNGTREFAYGVVMAGITGTALDPALPRFGGYLLFAGDGATVGDIRVLTDALRRRDDDLAPVIAIDQEGGSVARLRHDVEPIPSMMSLGAADDIALAQRAGEQTAFDLRRAGCTLDFAPVLDLALDSENAVIGTRSFGADPQRVASMGEAFARGLHSAGVIPCFKHFPGHGATSLDSHATLPVIETDAATLRGRDLVPFAAVAPAAPAMMSAHVRVPAFDPHNPATLSRRIASDMLRAELGFRGAFVTDCLEMGAVAASGSVESAVAALASGADLLLFSHDPALAVTAADAIATAVNEQRIPRERLEEAHARVVILREAGAQPLALEAFPPHPGVGREIGRRAVTLLRGVPHADPLSSIAVCFGARAPLLAREAPVLEELRPSIDPSAHETKTILTQLVESERRPLVLAQRPHRHPAQAEAVAEILERYPDTLLVSVFEPFGVPLFANARHFLAVYGDDVSSIGGLADVIFGGAMPAGRLPL